MVNFAAQPWLNDKVAVITGGSGVLCGTMALELARHGTRIAIVGRNTEKNDAMVSRIRADGGEAQGFSCDVTNNDSVAALRDAVNASLGRVDILINGAGGGHPKGNTTYETFDPSHVGQPDVTTFFDITPEGFGHVLDLNLLGSWLPSQHFARDMVGRSGSTIINISSMAAPVAITKVPAYSAAKAGIDSITQWMAVHLAPAGVRVNAIAPGFFLTEQNRRMLTNEDGSLTVRSEKVLAKTPMRRFGEPEDLLGVLLWLADHERSRFVTGITVPIDGGFMAYAGV